MNRSGPRRVWGPRERRELWAPHATIPVGPLPAPNWSRPSTSWLGPLYEQVVLAESAQEYAGLAKSLDPHVPARVAIYGDHGHDESGVSSIAGTPHVTDTRGTSHSVL